jgi:hypothetical protein
MERSLEIRKTLLVTPEQGDGNGGHGWSPSPPPVGGHALAPYACSWKRSLTSSPTCNWMKTRRAVPTGTRETERDRRRRSNPESTLVPPPRSRIPSFHSQLPRCLAAPQAQIHTRFTFLQLSISRTMSASTCLPLLTFTSRPRKPRSRRAPCCPLTRFPHLLSLHPSPLCPRTCCVVITSPSTL